MNVVLNQIVSVLRDAGIDAMLQYPDTPLDPKRGPVVCAAVKSGTRSGSGLGDYLGIREQDGRVSEVYGYRMELVVSMDIFVPWGTDGVSGAAACFMELSEALDALPSGLRLQTLRCGEAKADRDTEMLRCPVELECTAVMVCERDVESGEFTEFVLKGVLQS